uniref:RAS p21 protein activator 3 n=1 Tax=Callorhinchus milii TaxID=7868 RepID=A0A4W3JKW0_CALMI
MPPYPGPNKMRDCYCTVNLDQEEVFRTKIVEKSLCPFYGEDFYCEIPRSFRYLSFYIFDRDVFRRDSIIGKVAIKKDDLQKYHNRDTWFPLQQVDADSEVQVSLPLASKSCLVCLESQHRFIEKALTFFLVGRSEVKKTKVKRKTTNPQFDEVFYFEVSTYLGQAVIPAYREVDLWNASNLKFGDEFLGELRLPLKILKQSSSHQAWYFLQPRDNGKPVKPADLGSLRLNIVYTEDHVFLSHFYDPLRDLLLKSPDVEPVSASAGHVLGEVCREKQEAAMPLVRLFLHCGKIVPFISAIANDTLIQNTIHLCEDKSLDNICIDETMKLAGMHYLQVTLKPIIDEICEVHKPCEIDPVKLKDGENLESNMENLRQYVERIFNVITKSGMSCPTIMCDIFFSLRESAAVRFQGDPDVRYTAVSSFIFLRFFAPAILSPNLFQLRPHHPDPLTARTLTLLSKTIQTLGSLSKSKSVSHSSYSRYRYFLITTRKERMFMIKRAQGRNRFGIKNFKKRWFRLTNHEFTYHKHKVDHPLCSIPIENILAVEKLEEESFKMKNMYQVIQPERALYIQANNCVEAKDWIDILTKVSQCNKKRLTVYHPSAYLNGHWLCCKATADTALGCTPCTGGLPANIQLDVDGDRETERIYSLFSTYMTKLEKMQEACGSKSVYDGPEQEEYSTFIIDDPQETYKALRQIIEIVQTLEMEHVQYKRNKFKRTKYGSQ